MKTQLLRIFFYLFIPICFVLASETAYGQTVVVTSANNTATNGVAASPVISGQTNVVVLGFTVTVAGTANFTSFTLASSNGGYFVNGRLYRTAAGGLNYSGATLIASLGTGSVSTYISIPVTQTVTNTFYTYFFVADLSPSYGTIPGTDQFSFTNAIQSSPYGSFGSSFSGTNYALSNPTITFAANTTGVSTATTLVNGQSNVVLQGITISSNATTTINSAVLNYSSSLSSATTYFTNFELFVSTTGTGSFATATQVSGVTFSQGTNTIVASTGSSLTLTVGTYTTFYLVGTTSFSSACSFPSTFKVDLPTLSGSSPTVSYTNGSSSTSKTYTLVDAQISITDINNTTTYPNNGITQGSLIYGQTGIVLFGFGLTVTGLLNISTMFIPSNIIAYSYFTNGLLYRSTTPNFSTASQVGTVSYNAGVLGATIACNENFTSTTSTYYYWILADFTASTSFSAPTTIQYNFTTSQSPIAINATSSAWDQFNGFSTTNGKVFTIGATYNWIGITSINFNTMSNYWTLNNTAPTATSLQAGDQVQIGVIAYGYPGYQPTVSSNTTIAKLTFGSNNSPALTIASGTTLTVNANTQSGGNNTAMTVNSGASPVLYGPGILNLGGASSVTSGGTFTAEPTAIISLNDGSSSVANSGTFTLASSSAGSATIAAIPTGGAFTGNYNVQRYAVGGTGRRSYRLLSSPVYQSTYLGYPAYGFKALQATTIVSGGGLKGTYSSTQPTDGFDPSVTGNPSIFFYYEPNKDPINKVIANSDYKGISSIDALFPIGNGFLFFYRGNRNATDGTGISKLTTAAVPESTALNFYGTLNQGTISVAIPSGAIAAVSGTYPSATATISTTFSYTNSTATSDGLHLVGNPYPATIDLDAITLTNPYGSSANYIYMLNAAGTFGVYTKGSGSATLNNGVGRYVLSGQGFMVRGSSSGASVTFSESNKVNITPTATTPTSFAVEKQPTVLAMNRTLNSGNPQESRAFVDNQQQVMHILLSLDSVNANETVIQFGKGQNKFSGQEDAYYMSGLSQTTFLASYTTDAQPCLINQMGSLDSITSIPLYAQGSTSGLYKFQFSGASSIDPKYKIYLKDNLLKDSLDLSANNLYNFNIDITNPATYGATRFILVVYPTNIASYYHLLSFKGAKVNTGVQLTWNTQFEGDYTGFTLQRSIDGWKTFIVLDTLQSDGSGSYNFMDKNPIDGQNQYRLVQNNINNQNILSNIVTIGYQPVTSVSDKIQLYPNPAVSVINVNVKTENNPSYLTLKIFNTNGVLLVNTKTTSVNAFSQDVSKLTTGNYIIDITDNNTKHYGTVLFTKL